jgi:hypothetical protein
MSKKCHEQEDTDLPIIDTEDDEPYVVVLRIDVGDRKLEGLGGVTPPAFELARIGPMEDIDKGDLKPCPRTSYGTSTATPLPCPILSGHCSWLRCWRTTTPTRFRSSTRHETCSNHPFSERGTTLSTARIWTSPGDSSST